MMLKNDKDFDEYLKYFSVADVDVQFIDSVGDDWMTFSGTDCETDDAAEATVATKVIAIPPATATACNQKPPKTRGRSRARRTTSTSSTRSTGRFKARQQNAKPRRRIRDRRRNEHQRKRENEKRKEKQSEFICNRDACFEAEGALRRRVTGIVSDLAARMGVAIDQVMHMLPGDLQAIMQSSDAAMRRFRAFTGQKHICAKLNSFPMWPAIADPFKREPLGHL